MIEFNVQSPLVGAREASIQTKATPGVKTSSKEAQHVAIVLRVSIYFSESRILVKAFALTLLKV